MELSRYQFVTSQGGWPAKEKQQQKKERVHTVQPADPAVPRDFIYLSQRILLLNLSQFDLSPVVCNQRSAAPRVAM